jgi:hypothetical protein
MKQPPPLPRHGPVVVPDTPGQRAWRFAWVIVVATLASLVFVGLKVGVHTSYQSCMRTGSTRSESTFLGIVYKSEQTVSPLEKWLVGTGWAVEHKWLTTLRTRTNYLGTRDEMRSGGVVVAEKCAEVFDEFASKVDPEKVRDVADQLYSGDPFRQSKAMGEIQRTIGRRFTD